MRKIENLAKWGSGSGSASQFLRVRMNLRRFTGKVCTTVPPEWDIESLCDEGGTGIYISHEPLFQDAIGIICTFPLFLKASRSGLGVAEEVNGRKKVYGFIMYGIVSYRLVSYRGVYKK